jgi:hypothetical protein
MTFPELTLSVTFVQVQVTELPQEDWDNFPFRALVCSALPKPVHRVGGLKLWGIKIPHKWPILGPRRHLQPSHTPRSPLPTADVTFRVQNIYVPWDASRFFQGVFQQITKSSGSCASR